jgi:hypothetical protein
MLDAGAIIGGLERIANEWLPLAVFWHVYFAVLLAVLLLGYRPGPRPAGIFLGLPLLSVSILAWLQANSFNGSIFALAALALMLSPPSLDLDGSRRAGAAWRISGLLLFVPGWTYPHFLAAGSFLPYLYAAPIGLIPCPTLLGVTGLVLVGGAPGPSMGKAVLTATGMFYGLFGALRLGFGLDWLLVAGCLVLLMHSFGRRGRPYAPVP